MVALSVNSGSVSERQIRAITLKRSMPTKTNHRPAALMALAASAGLTVLVIVGLRNLEHYDAALFGYTVASVVAFGAIVFRYAIWLQRPATRVYWRRGWKLFRDRKNLIANTSSAAKTIVGGMAIQKFIFIATVFSHGNQTSSSSPV